MPLASAPPPISGRGSSETIYEEVGSVIIQLIRKKN